MAEGWGRRAFLGGDTQVFSAGIEIHGLNPLAVQVMAEAGVDISDQKSQLVADLPVQCFDLVITVCGQAHEHCPVFLGETEVIHRGFDDPPYLTRAETDPEKVLDQYRRVRDEIRDYVQTLVSS